jgi:hypothetical protein
MYVCFGSLTDANARIWDVRFNSQSGRVRQLASMSAKCHKLTWSLAERQSHSCDEFAELTSRPRVARLCSNCHLVGNADQQQANSDVPSFHEIANEEGQSADAIMVHISLNIRCRQFP